MHALHPLDRPIWSALTTRQANLALGDGRAVRLAPDYGLFAAAADASPQSLASLAALVPAGGQVALVEAEEPPSVPGDVLYLPRGTLHSVESDQESLHLAIGFTPLTVRDAVLAALDHLSDLDPALRAPVGGRVAFQLKGAGFERLGLAAADGAARLLAACKAPGFLPPALQRRSSRAVALLAALPADQPTPAIGLDTVLMQSEGAFCHLTATAETIDLSYPGGRLHIHRGAQESVLYVVNTVRFRVRDIPGAVEDDVRLSLAAKFLQVGFLQLAPAEAMQPSIDEAAA